MNEEPDNLPKKSWSVSSPVLIWLALFTAIVLGTMILAWSAPTAFEEPLHPLAIFMVGIVGASFLLWLRPGLRRLFCWLNLRRTLIGLAVVATLIGLFYTEENWRGKKAWDDCKRELEARGAALNWSTYIPPPVPDDQNIFKAPKMQEWFVGKGPNELLQRLNLRPAGDPRQISTNGSPVIVAELTALLPADTKSDPVRADATLRFDDPAARTEARKLIDNALGPTASGSQGYIFTARRLNRIQPAHVRILAERVPTTNELEELFARNTSVAAAAWGQRPDRLRVESAGTHAFQVSLSLPEGCPAADYLAWSETLEADFDSIRQALKRPYARMEGDYQHPVAQPIPNFVCIRNLAQTLAQRAQCHGLLGQGDKALQDLTLLHDLSRLLEARPTGRPVTLVAAMINVAVTGLYVDTVADGFRLQAWREPQLVAIQEQLARTHLMPLVAEGLRNEQVSSPRTLETTTRTGLRKIFSFGDAAMNFWRNLKDPTSFALALMPRGWVYQNMVVHARLLQKGIEGMDATNQIVLPHKEAEFASEMEATFNHFSPYTCLAAMSTPNFVRVVQTVARTQTRVEQALAVCALERHRLARGQYPEMLAALAPQFIDQLPHDIVGGKPLKYRRMNEGQFVLYSVGWNEADDGGTAASTDSNAPRANFDERDWVWGQPAN